MTNTISELDRVCAGLRANTEQVRALRRSLPAESTIHRKLVRLEAELSECRQDAEFALDYLDQHGYSTPTPA